MNPGSIVQVRNRYWVLLPNEDPDIYLLRPLIGATDEVVALHKGLTDLLGYTFPQERLRSATFPLPTTEDVADAASAYLLWQAARLILREGASPLRSLGRISIRPRTYQFVPLLMALRLDPVRLLIADDVGVGKTIEALLIARELWERGEVRRMAVLCPPYLCDQWQKELSEKFNLEAVVIRSGTVGQLERNKPPTRTIYEHYPIQVASIDYLKSERNRHQFLLCAPELILVDEVHGAAMAGSRNQQQRHELLRELARDVNRHLILLTATPHSGIEEAFRSLLGLLNPRFAEWNIDALNDDQRDQLARHFVQRTRKDIERHWESELCFPERLPEDKTYHLSPAYRELFQKTYDFCAEIVRSGERLEEHKRRVRYWGALALLRCVMSSPAAAIAALENRAARLGESDLGEDEVDFRGFVFESSEDRTDDEQPTPPIEEAELTLEQSERRRLRELARLAGQIAASQQDTKLQGVIRLTQDLLAEGYHPIIWCRYVATAEYVAEGLRSALGLALPDLQIICITGRQADEERRARIAEIEADRPRVLVATDCLSEGINLQEKFTAAVHYDLPWNPNRLEQREGRVDRYGQPARRVKAVRYFSPDSPVDGVVLDVLLNKAREIYQALGTHVPVPEESESVTEAVLRALFLRGYRRDPRQLELDLGMPKEVEQLHHRWRRDAERESINRTRFAQHALKPEEVQRELEAADAVLGDPNAVREFVLTAAQRLGLTIEREKRGTNVYRLVVAGEATQTLPDPIRFALPRRKDGLWRVSFVSPTPEGAEYLGRNHPFVQALARYLFEAALVNRDPRPARRTGAIATRSVSEATTLYLLRLRYLLTLPQRAPLMLEEVRIVGVRRDTASLLGHDECLVLLGQAQPDANLDLATKQRLAQEAIRRWPWGGEAPDEGFRRSLEDTFLERAVTLEESHKAIRRSLRLRVRELTLDPQMPPDLLGVLVLLPVGGAA